ncbi:MAG: lipoyl(octanoyl) transferase LipB [Cyanobacteria bacterium]|nr:lipoyl(octanoyl) transferase LipB [Cyanobacteriota bacterium]
MEFPAGHPHGSPPSPKVALAPPVCCLWRGDRVPYDTVWAYQQELVAARRTDPTLPDVLMLLEHPPVYTLGQGADPNFVRFTPGAEDPPVIRIERGGEVTYHCPGQLVGYPILNLRRHRTDLHWYLRQLEAVLIATLAELGLTGDRQPPMTGVWVAGHKVAAIGIKVSRWITMHGFALNICPDLAGFDRIVPCGIENHPVGSLTQWLPGLTRADVEPIVMRQFANHFQYRLVPGDGSTMAVPRT